MANDPKKPSPHPRRNFLRQTASLGMGLAATNLVGWEEAMAVVQSRLQDNAGCCLVYTQAQQIIHSLSTTANSESSALLHSSGNSRFDSAFGMMLAQMASIFEVRPGFAFNDFTNPYHHGTREERLGMIEAGFGGAHLPLWGAIEAGMNAVGA